jgi:hypothetical protein
VARAPANAPRSDEAEPCGIGGVETSAQAASGAVQVPRHLIEAARRRLRSEMQASPDTAVRAAGLLFEAMTARASDPAVDRLALLAAHSSEPAAYALAMAGCGGVLPRPQRGSGWCRLLSAEQWARLDPDNALPWLAVAGAAHERGDATVEADAMHHASVAHLADDRTSLLPRLVADLMPGDVPSALRTQAIIDVLGVQAALPYAGYHAALRYCPAEAARDGNRRQQCAALATLLVERGMTWADTVVGRGIGARAAGWPSERVEALRDEQRALVEAAGSIVDVEQPLGCASGRRLASWVRLVDEIGEPDAAREWLRRSGRSVDDALKQSRERRAAAGAQD